MVFHRLRVISFSKPLLSTNTSSKKEIDLKVHNKVEVLTHKKAHNKKVTKACRTVCIQNSSSPIVPLPVRPCLKCKSRSEIFRIPIKTLKNRTIGKTLSLKDFKSQHSLKESISFNQMKEKLQTQKNPRKEKAIKDIKKHDIKVLYVAETRSRNLRRFNMHHRKQDISESSDNLFGFYRSKRLIYPHTYSQNYEKSGNPFHKLKTRSVRRRKQFHEASTDYSHHPLKVITSGKIRVSQSYLGAGCSDPLLCNILRFPHTTKPRARQKNSSLKLYRSGVLPKDNVGCDHSLETKNTHKVSRGQIASTSNLETLLVCVDKAVSTCKSLKLLKSSKSFKHNPELKSSNERRKCYHSTRKLPIKKIYSKIYNKLLAGTVSAHSKQRLSMRTITKHILVSLVVVAWSPCVFAMGVCWAISYPLRHQHVASAYYRRKYRRKDNCDGTQYQYDWWSAFTNYLTRVTNETKKALSTVLLFKRQSKLEVLPHRSHPDPSRRYTLFHAQDRGWVIKPVRVQDLHPKQNWFLQIFQNLFCVCYHPYHPSTSQRKSRVKHRPSSHDPCKKTCNRKSVPRKHLNSKHIKQLESKHEDCKCLDPSKSKATQKPDLTCKSCTKTNKTVNITCKNEPCKKLNTKREHEVCKTPVKPPAIANKEGLCKPCLLRDDFNLSCKCKHCKPRIISAKANQLDYKHRDCTCLDQSKSGAKQKPDLTCKPCAETNRSVNQACKKFNTKREDKVYTTSAKPPAILNGEELSKQCLLRNDFDVSCKPCLTEPGLKTVSENLVQAPKSGERLHKRLCKCQTKVKKPSDANNSNKIISTQSTPQATSMFKSSSELITPKSGKETCRSCSIASKETVSEKLLNTKRDRDALSIFKQSPKKKVKMFGPCNNSTCSGLLETKRSRSVKNQPCNNSTCSRLLETKRSRSATRPRRPGTELVLPKPVPSRSVFKKYASLTRRSISKPDHDVVIVEPGPVLGSGDPPKLIRKYTKQSKSGPNKPDAKSTKASSPEKGLRKSDAKSKRSNSPESFPKKLDAKSWKASSPKSAPKKSDAKSKKASSPKKSDMKSTKVSSPQNVTTVTQKNPKHESKIISEPTVPSSSKDKEVKIETPINKDKIQKEKSLKMKKLSVGQRFMAWVRGLFRNTTESVNSYDKELQSIFPADVRCGDLYLYTLRSRPCYWIYKAKPSLYPLFLRLYYCSKSCCSHCLFSISLCLCAPIAFCCYVYYQLCLSCCGCC